MSVSVSSGAWRPFSRAFLTVAVPGLFLLVLAALPAPVWAADTARARPSQRDVLTGPVEARVIAVRDGDTLRVRARIWLGQEIVVNVRLSGVDAPELRARCAAERALAERARAFVVSAVGARPVRLRRIRNGKYAGRVLAEVETGDGADLGAALRRAGLARAYRGGRRLGWCG